MKILNGVALTFDDVLLRPCKSDISSRFSGEIDTTTDLFPLIDIKTMAALKPLRVPIISANMDRVTEINLAREMYNNGGLGIIHRFMSIEKHVEQLKQLDWWNAVGCIGTGDSGKERADAIAPYCKAILIDVAHGHSSAMIDQTRWLKKAYPYIQIITGNVATFQGAMDLIAAGTNCIKIGVGCGSLCSTRLHAGVGVPQLTAILEVARAVHRVSAPITLIADGGIRNSGDIMKSIAAGADAVMIGNLFSGTEESPGRVHKDRNTGQLYKTYRGLASEEAQIEWKGYARSIEGESTKVPYKGSLKQIFSDLTSGILSGMSYLNARTLTELRENAIFVRQTSAGYRESIPFGLETNRW